LFNGTKYILNTIEMSIFHKKSSEFHN
jgi:hypothetical protein